MPNRSQGNTNVKIYGRSQVLLTAFLAGIWCDCQTVDSSSHLSGYGDHDLRVTGNTLLHSVASIPAWGALVMHLMERDSCNRKTHVLCLHVFIDTCTSMLVFPTISSCEKETHGLYHLHCNSFIL